MLHDIVNKPIQMKSYFSPAATSLLKQLLERDPAKRLGSGQTDAEEIKQHEFFADIDWEAIRTRTHQAVYIPRVKGAEDTSCIDKLFTREGL